MTDGPGPDKGAISAGAIRLASGVAFLVIPERANRAWGGDPDDVGPTASLLLRSMGYRDALIGAGLVWTGIRGSRAAAAWFLASAGADLADLVGGLANHGDLSDSAKRRGIGGAVTGIVVGLTGAARVQRAHRAAEVARSLSEGPAPAPA